MIVKTSMQTQKGNIKRDESITISNQEPTRRLKGKYQATYLSQFHENTVKKHKLHQYSQYHIATVIHLEFWSLINVL